MKQILTKFISLILTMTFAGQGVPLGNVPLGNVPHTNVPHTCLRALARGERKPSKDIFADENFGATLERFGFYPKRIRALIKRYVDPRDEDFEDKLASKTGDFNLETNDKMEELIELLKVHFIVYLCISPDGESMRLFQFFRDTTIPNLLTLAGSNYRQVIKRMFIIIGQVETVMCKKDFSIDQILGDMHNFVPREAIFAAPKIQKEGMQALRNAVILAIRKRETSVGRDYPIIGVLAEGSFPRGNATILSDVDIIVVTARTNETLVGEEWTFFEELQHWWAIERRKLVDQAARDIMNLELELIDTKALSRIKIGQLNKGEAFIAGAGEWIVKVLHERGMRVRRDGIYRAHPRPKKANQRPPKPRVRPPLSRRKADSMASILRPLPLRERKDAAAVAEAASLGSRILRFLKRWRGLDVGAAGDIPANLPGADANLGRKNKLNRLRDQDLSWFLTKPLSKSDLETALDEAQGLLIDFPEVDDLGIPLHESLLDEYTEMVAEYKYFRDILLGVLKEDNCAELFRLFEDKEARPLLLELLGVLEVVDDKYLVDFRSEAASLRDVLFRGVKVAPQPHLVAACLSGI